jgi:hypothetical protein
MHSTLGMKMKFLKDLVEEMWNNLEILYLLIVRTNSSLIGEQ